MFNPQKNCSFCGEELHIERLRCPECGIALEGDFKLSTFAGLDADEQNFVFQFILASGSLKEMEKRLKISYPTVRNRLDQIIKKLQRDIVIKKVLKTKKERIIELAEEGRISYDAAEEIIKEIL